MNLSTFRDRLIERTRSAEVRNDIAGLRARAEATEAEHQAAREVLAAFGPPPDIYPDVSDAEVAEYEQAREADSRAFLAREDAWFELDARLHPGRYPEGQWPRVQAGHEADAAAPEAEPGPPEAEAGI